MKALVTFAAVGLLLSAATAEAAVIDCPSNLLDNVSNTSACQYSDTADQDNTKPPLVVNEEAFFGFTDWLFYKKEEGTDYTGLSGTWSVGADFWPGYENGMMIFKDGAGTTLVGYLIIGGRVSGTWSTPFENPPFTAAPTAGKDTSHISFYRRVGDGDCCEQDLPEPGTLAMLGLGLLGLGISRRRKMM